MKSHLFPSRSFAASALNMVLRVVEVLFGDPVELRRAEHERCLPGRLKVSFVFFLKGNNRSLVHKASALVKLSRRPSGRRIVSGGKLMLHETSYSFRPVRFSMSGCCKKAGVVVISDDVVANDRIFIGTAAADRRIVLKKCKTRLSFPNKKA